MGIVFGRAHVFDCKNAHLSVTFSADKSYLVDADVKHKLFTIGDLFPVQSIISKTKIYLREGNASVSIFK